jgi:hypothetical protein
LFSGGDGFAQTAGMLAVERFRHRVAKRTRLNIVRQHRRPRDRLQRRPMQASRRDERENHQKFSEADEHADKLNRADKNARIEKFKS